jgi:hypothetical protein
MIRRSTSETIEDLSQLLKDLEEPRGSNFDPTALNDLKHLVLKRIAELKAAETPGPHGRAA